MIENNVFGWLSAIERNELIIKRTHWIDINELKKHEDQVFVVYYLVDEKKKEIYIGHAKRLGDRVKPRRHEIPGWNKFMYEIISPDFHELLEEIEYHSIMSYARFLNNNGNLSSLKISSYTLVNKDYKYYTN
jgi:hypothetical protein